MTYSLFFFNDTATTEIYTLSLHDALPISTINQDTEISRQISLWNQMGSKVILGNLLVIPVEDSPSNRSEEHTSELQSHLNLVCRLLLEKKKTNLINKQTKKRR